MTLRRFIAIVVFCLVAMGAQGPRHGDEFQAVGARAARSDAPAQNQLGVMYPQDQGIPHE